MYYTLEKFENVKDVFYAKMNQKVGKRWKMWLYLRY